MVGRKKVFGKRTPESGRISSGNGYNKRIQEVVSAAKKAGVETLVDDLNKSKEALQREIDRLEANNAAIRAEYQKYWEVRKELGDTKKKLNEERALRKRYWGIIRKMAEESQENPLNGESFQVDEDKLSEFRPIDGFEKMSWGEQIEKFTEKMIETGLVSLVDERDFYKILINIPGKGKTTLLCTKDRVETYNDKDESKILDYDAEAEARYGCVKMSKGDTPTVTDELFILLDKLGHKKYDDDCHAFFAGFMHFIMHKLIPGYNKGSYFWYKDRFYSFDTKRKSNVFLRYINPDKNDVNGIPQDGWSAESGNLLYMNKDHYK